MDSFRIGDIIVIKPEYSKVLIETYSSGYSDEKCKFGLAVAHGAPAKVVACAGDCGWLTDLQKTLQRDDCLYLSRKYFDAFMPPITDDLL